MTPHHFFLFLELRVLRRQKRGSLLSAENRSARFGRKEPTEPEEVRSRDAARHLAQTLHRQRRKIGRERRPESSPGPRECVGEKVGSGAGLLAASDEHLGAEAGGEELDLPGTKTERSQEGSRFQ